VGIATNEGALPAPGFLPIRGYSYSFVAEMSFPLRGGKIATPTSWKSACVSHSRRDSVDRRFSLYDCDSVFRRIASAKPLMSLAAVCILMPLIFPPALRRAFK
jgi:hypothetical protein